MAVFDLALPRISDGDLDDEKQRRRIMNYLYKLDEQLRYVLNNLDADNLTETFLAEISTAGAGGGMHSTAEMRSEIARLQTQISQTAAQITLKADAAELDALGRMVNEINA